eukprot:1521621-Pyramimonas_sp.AAC.1
MMWSSWGRFLGGFVEERTWRPVFPRRRRVGDVVWVRLLPASPRRAPLGHGGASGFSGGDL